MDNSLLCLYLVTLCYVVESLVFVIMFLLIFAVKVLRSFMG